MGSLVRAIAVLTLLAGTACSGSGQGGQALLGSWSGRALFRGSTLEFSLRFFRQRDTLRATFSSPDLLILEQPLDSVRLDGKLLSFATTDEYPLRFRGTLKADSIHGNANPPAVPGVVEAPAGADSPGMQFDLHRVAAPAPPPYSSREVRFSGGGGVLTGTLLIPATIEGLHGGVVILQGSSSNLREEYRFYADHFARAGLAVLAFDKRGKGESAGDYGTASYDDLAADGAAALAFLRAQPGVDDGCIGVWGLSQGAFIAPLVARLVPDLSFLVAVSAPGVPIGESAAWQDSVRLLNRGFAPSNAAVAAELNRQILRWFITGGDRAPLDAALARVSGTPWRRASSLPERLPVGPSIDGWYWRGRALDPIPLWRSLRTPVLALFGAADELVPATVSAARIQRALTDGRNPDATVRVFPAANHVLRQLPLVAGGTWDWPRAAPGYLRGMTEWIIAHSQ